MGLCLFLFQVAHAEPSRINDRVVSKADGDTLTILVPASNVQHKIRLAGIDAPKNRQPFGERSHQHLAHLAQGRDATLQCHKIDSYRRRVPADHDQSLVAGYSHHRGKIDPSLYELSDRRVPEGVPDNYRPHVCRLASLRFASS